MADDKPGGAWGSSFIVLAFAAVSALYVAHEKPPLVSSRPTDPEYQVHQLSARQDLDARLWDDPIAAVMRDAEENRGGNPQADSRHSIPNEPPGTLALAVTLPGAPYPEVAETRRRLRYAVLSALHVAGYAPTDEKHIGYFRTGNPPPAPNLPRTQVRASGNAGYPLTGGVAQIRATEPSLAIGVTIRLVRGGHPEATTDEPNEPPLPGIVPWEEFDSSGPAESKEPRKHVLVLWVDEDFLAAGGKPIGGLMRLRRQLKLPADGNFAVLGPEDSTTLAAMVREAESSKQCLSTNGQGGSGRPTDIYNFGATADEQEVLRLAGSTQTAIGTRLATLGIGHYYRTVNTDQELAERLAAELVRRDFDLGLKAGQSHRDHIVLISDWDTVYGQYLRDSVTRAFDPQGTAGDSGKASSPPWITTVGYLRGLDGRLPDRKYAREAKSLPSEDPGQKPKDPAGATPETATQFEAAEGQSQFDYLRRLAADLDDRDAEFRQDGGRIAAIGVLGSDVYDKLLILQALRPEFPDALFFTTDLDALLLPQNKSRYTRNLLVASSFGLKLNDVLQKDMPPFRSTYQASIFRAARLAIQNEFPRPSPDASGGDAGAGKTQAAPPCWAPQPVLFQIGRSAPQPLPYIAAHQPCTDGEGREPALGTDAGNLAALLSAVQPSPGKLFPELPAGNGILASAVLLSTALLLCIAFSTRAVRHLCIPLATKSDGSVQARQPRYWLLIAALAITLAGSFAFWWAWRSIADSLTEGGNGEALSLFEGTSLWPTIALRAIGATLTLWLICYTLRSLKDNKLETEKELSFFNSKVSLCKEWESIRSNIESHPTQLSRFASLLWFDAVPRDHGERPLASFLSLTGKFAGRSPARCIRSVIGVLAMFALWQILAPILGEPNVPARGPRVHGIYVTVTAIEVFFTLFLIFLVADATLFSRAFIKRLTAVSTEWPITTVGIFERRFDLRGTDLADWIDVQFLARRTRCITRLIYLPFVALAFLVVSRSALFDDFTWPLTLVVTQAVSVVVVVGSVVSLRLAAENARVVAREHLNTQIIAAKGREDARARAARMKKLLEQIDGLNEGAFAPWWSQPLVKALLLPLVTYGGALMLHQYAIPGI